MTLKEHIMQFYPSLSENDFGLKDDGNGISISNWNSNEVKPSDELVKEWVEEFTFSQTKQNKINEIDNACEQTILGRFKSTVDGIEHEFSYDSQAQSRFSGIASSFTRGYLTEIEWTCYLNGERTSVILNEAQFDVVAKNALFHEASNISKFRQKVKEIESASTIEQVKQISW